MRKKPQTAAAGHFVAAGMMTHAQHAALKRALGGEDPNATVVIPAANLPVGSLLSLPTNGLQGATINDDGDGV